jgi:hypothetical protein
LGSLSFIYITTIECLVSPREYDYEFQEKEGHANSVEKRNENKGTCNYHLTEESLSVFV